MQDDTSATESETTLQRAERMAMMPEHQDSKGAKPPEAPPRNPNRLERRRAASPTFQRKRQRLNRRRS